MRTSIRLSSAALLLAVCLGLSALESFLLPVFSIALPGVKLGISNVVILFCIGRRKTRLALLLAVSRALLCAMLFGSPVTLLLSLSGGLVSLLAMHLSRPLLTRGFSFLSVSVAGSVAFQLGQGAASIFLYSTAVLYYLPALLFCAVLTGAILGIVENCLFARVNRLIPTEE